MSDVRQVLLRAAELVGRGWCQGTYALDAEGRQVDPTQPEAVAWCVAGAMIRAAFELAPNIADAQSLYSEAYARFIGQAGSVATWNDRRGRTKDEVIEELRWGAQ